MSSEKKPTFAAPSKITRQSSVPPSSTRKMMNATTSRIRSTPQQKVNPNATALDGDCTIRPEAGDSFDWKFEFKRGEFMRTWLTEILADEKFEHEEKVMDVQLAQLADRFQKTYDLLDNTSKRMKDISFVVEQKRLLDLRTQDCAQFYDITTSSDIENKVSSVITAQQASLDKLETKNIDVGYDKESGHKKLLDAVTEALEGLEQIKNNSNLDPDKLAEYSKSAKSLAEVEKDRIDLESLKDEFEAKYSWYNDAVLKDTSEKLDLLLKIGSELSRQLDLWLSKADLTHGPARAIIAPHAGYSYSGACAAFAYRQISPVVVKRIFILGPSHHVRLGGCALSSLDKYQTPLYDLTIDKQIYAELEATRQFEWMDVQTDEDEHSIEMHLPYIAKVMEEYKTGFTIIPILVGSLTPEKEAKYGAILAPYLADPQNLFVISSDFCHWGYRFRFMWRDPSKGHIHQGIEWLDRQGMDIIEKMDPRAFTEYLNKYSNTICGRHPIGVLLHAIEKLRGQSPPARLALRFLKYAQSSQCTTAQDSSVSYASASLLFD